MVHKPKHKVHSFRGLLGDGGQDEINLERQNVNLAYRIVKFQIMPPLMGTESSESTVKIYKDTQSSIDSNIDFSDPTLLAAAYIENESHGNYIGVEFSVIFDNVLFSRNIFVTHDDVKGDAVSCNYYIEIEEVPVGAATLMQLKLQVARTLSLTQ